MKLNYGEYNELFNKIPIDAVPNQDFLKFISIEVGKKKFQNLDLLLKLEGIYPGLFVKAMLDFEKVKKLRIEDTSNGKRKTVSWEESLKRFYIREKYNGVTKENEDIAEVFVERGLPQHLFDEAVELRKQAKDNNIPEHLLGKQLKEETILESIERIKSQTEEELASVREIIGELYDKQFTYEWLNKYDPNNFIIGLLCDSCASITKRGYGYDIAKKGAIAPDTQNIVVRNIKGEIIAKGIMYINKDKGYAVINDYEIDGEYKKHEDEYNRGRYNVEETSKEEQEREMIFKAFQRGLSAFIKEYDEQNPDNPLIQVNIGMGYNRLKKQVERFKKATSNLTVPAEYLFNDSREEQYILYKKEQNELETIEEVQDR